MQVEVHLPDDVAAQWGSDPEVARARLQLELGLHLYASRQVSIGRAAEISGVSRGDFERVLASSGVVRNYSASDLEDDLAWAQG